MNRELWLWTLLLSGLLVTAPLHAHGDYDQGQYISIISPLHGAVVTNPVRVRLQASGVKIAPAGVDKHRSGHFHLMVDVDADPQLDEPMQENDQHIRLSNGEMEVTLMLAPGRHTLQVILADEEHTHFENMLSSKITILVE